MRDDLSWVSLIHSLGSKLVGRLIFPECEVTAPITLSAVNGRQKKLFHFASPNRLSSSYAAAGLLRFLLLLLNDMVFLVVHRHSIADMIWDLRYLLQVHSDRLAAEWKWNMHDMDQHTSYSPGCIRRALESVRCETYTYYSEGSKLSGILEEISTL